MSLESRIRRLVGILDREGLEEIEVRNLWSTVRVRRSAASGARPEPVPSGRPGVAAAGGRISEPAHAVEAEPGSAPAEEESEGSEKVLSPMVGTFYRSGGPDSEPYVSVGTTVEVGQVLCIIEAMKLMNEIEAEKKGVIRKILVEDAQPVEFGQPLFILDSA